MNASLLLPSKLWIELHDNENASPDACDVLVQMDNSALYTALFVTLPYLGRQMALSYALAEDLGELPPVRYAALDVQHIVVDALDRNTIEDVVDNLIAQDLFDAVFTRVTDDTDEAPEGRTASTPGTRATQEVAAVVLSDVLVVEGGD